MVREDIKKKLRSNNRLYPPKYLNSFLEYGILKGGLYNANNR